MDDCKLLWRCLACRRAWGTLETWKAPILMPLSIMYTFYISTTLGYLLQQFARSPPSPAKRTAHDCAGKSHIEFIISKGWSYGPTSNKMALNFKRTLNPMWVLNIIWIYFRGSAYFLAEQCFRNSLGKGGKWGWVGGQKVMEAGGDSDLSLFTNRVPAKYLPRILVPKKASGLARPGVWLTMVEVARWVRAADYFSISESGTGYYWEGNREPHCLLER